MDFDYGNRVEEYAARIESFLADHIYPNEDRFYRESETLGPWKVFPVVEELKAIAKAEGLWNLFLPDSKYGAGLSNLEYAPLCALMGRSHLAPEVFNCSAPDTGNMETIIRYGTEAQINEWAEPLLRGEIRSAFAMTEPAVASSDATNIESSIVREGDDYIINGRKWYTTNATDPRCKIIIFMGKSSPDNESRYKQQSMILVPKDTPGVRVIRPLPVFGFYGVPDRASEVVFDNVRVPVSNMLLGEGRGFEIAQGRLGPGRIHHCMRSIGSAEKALQLLCERATEREAFGRPLYKLGANIDIIADARMNIEQARLLTLKTAWMMDHTSPKEARIWISMIKTVVPNMALKVIDDAIQMHGGIGVSQDTPLAEMWSGQRTLRLADGPDAVHRMVVGRHEIKQYLAEAGAVAATFRDG